MVDTTYIRWLENLDNNDVPVVGGKNASLGEMLRGLKGAGIQVPDGFATTAEGYRQYIQENSLQEKIGRQREMKAGLQSDESREKTPHASS